MAAVECLTQEQAQSCLEDLKIGLLTLHHYLLIGNQYYNFETYKPEPEVVQDYGAEGALNQDLENIFCPKGRVGPICLKETGPGLEAVAEVLDKWIEKHPKSVVLQKWVDDLIAATEYVAEVSGNDEI